jgi:GNAT superfamily N-acetyltransferase
VSFRVRLFADGDYPAFARIKTLAEGRRFSTADVRAEDLRWDHARYEKVRVVAADEEDAPLAYGEIYHEPSRFEPRRYFLRLGVDGPRRRQGIGRAIWDRLAAELDERAAIVCGLWTGDRTACQAFIQKRGFVEVVRAYEQVIALARAPLPLRAAEARVGSGIALRTLADLVAERGRPAVVEAYDLHTAARLDQPTLGPVTAQPLADWLVYNVEAPEALTDAYFIALDGERFVGCSSVRRRSEDQLEIGITAVLPAYRRRGIARLLKLRVHEWGRRNGYVEIHTSTTGPNVGMLRLNESLGYVVVGSWGGYELLLSGGRYPSGHPSPSAA